MVSWMHPEKKAVSRLNSDALVTQLPSNSQGKNNNFAVIFNEQRKCDYSVNLNQNNKVSTSLQLYK